jgi:organic radical activating enzyme
LRNSEGDLHLRMLLPRGGVMMYPVTTIFRSLQGEGHFVGYPMVFLRLAGCSVLGCHIRAECDEAPWKMRERMTVGQIVDAVRRHQSAGIVCITGGEPTDHDLVPLICGLRDAGFRVHMETSGVRSVCGMPIEWLTVSPKLNAEGFKQRVGHTLKVVVRPEWATDKVWDVLDSFRGDFLHRYLQPMSVGGSPPNLEQVIGILLSERNAGGEWALSTQAHKTWSVL